MAQTRSRRVAAFGVVMLTVFVMTGCSLLAREEMPTLAREQVAADVLPADLVAQLGSDKETAIDLDSVRLAGEHKGAQFFAARTGNHNYCLIIYATAEKWVSGCSQSPQIEVYSQGGYSARFTTDGILPQGVNEHGWVALTDDVLVHKANANLHTGPQ
jgi:hypothetical protein